MLIDYVVENHFLFSINPNKEILLIWTVENGSDVNNKRNSMIQLSFQLITLTSTEQAKK